MTAQWCVGKSIQAHLIEYLLHLGLGVNKPRPRGRQMTWDIYAHIYTQRQNFRYAQETHTLTHTYIHKEQKNAWFITSKSTIHAWVHIMQLLLQYWKDYYDSCGYCSCYCLISLKHSWLVKTFKSDNLHTNMKSKSLLTANVISHKNSLNTDCLALSLAPFPVLFLVSQYCSS